MNGITNRRGYERATRTESEPLCDDPRHDELCDCGATPDEDFEAYRMEQIDAARAEADQ